MFVCSAVRWLGCNDLIELDRIELIEMGSRTLCVWRVTRGGGCSFHAPHCGDMRLESKGLSLFVSAWNGGIGFSLFFKV